MLSGTPFPRLCVNGILFLVKVMPRHTPHPAARILKQDCPGLHGQPVRRSFF